MRRKTVVITGGAGFVAANLARSFLQEFAVHLIVRPDSNLWRLESIRKQVRIHPLGLGDTAMLRSLFTDIHPSYIVHTAAYGAYPSQQDTDMLVDVNIKGAIHLLEALRDIPYQRCIIFGSSSEYGKKRTAMQETDLLEPNNMYAVTKAAQTHIAQQYARVSGKPISVFRLFNVYGPMEERGRLVRNVIEASLAGTDIKLATGREARDFIFVDDIAAACRMAFARQLPSGGLYNIGTGKQTTIAQLAQLVVCLTGSKSHIIRNAYEGRPWDTFHWKASTRHTARGLGWKAQTSLRAGLLRTIASYTSTL